MYDIICRAETERGLSRKHIIEGSPSYYHIARCVTLDLYRLVLYRYEVKTSN